VFVVHNVIHTVAKAAAFRTVPELGFGVGYVRLAAHRAPVERLARFRRLPHLRRHLPSAVFDPRENIRPEEQQHVPDRGKYREPGLP
jgi:hypothetical protein